MKDTHIIFNWIADIQPIITEEGSYTPKPLDFLKEQFPQFNPIPIPEMIDGTYLCLVENADDFDVIYYDPMYPPSKKSALGSGQLEYLSKILEVEQISNEPQMDFEVLQLMPVNKMIVKRPIKAEPFNPSINYQVSGKTTRFDVYI